MVLSILHDSSTAKHRPSSPAHDSVFRYGLCLPRSNPPQPEGLQGCTPPALTRLVSTHSVVLFAAFCSSIAVTRERKASTGEIRNVLIKPIRFRRIFLLPWFTVFLVCMAKNVEQGRESPVLSFLCFLKEISVKL